MPNQLLPNTPHKNFEGIKKIDENGIEYWEAHELMSLLGYNRWENFQNVIEKAKYASIESKQKVISHFLEVTKMVTIGSGAKRQTTEYRLSRYACYLIAQNGDPRKKEIAIAQTYFAIQTRKQEIFQQLNEDGKRLFIRNEVKEQNKLLLSTAKSAGVTNFGKFNNMGYLGLYGMSLPKLKAKKSIGKDNILDRAGTTELAANLFRITQTDDKIKKENIKGDGRASATHFSVGSKVRESIEKIGGTMPEDLPPQKHIKELEKENKKIAKEQNKLL